MSREVRRVTLTRDSVAMGDDACAPHEAEAELAGDRLRDLGDWLVEHTYVASVEGGSTWVLRVGTDPAHGVAVLQRPDGRQQPGARVTLLWVADPEAPLSTDRAHLDYCLAQPPEHTAALVREDPARPTFRSPR